jgi:hypothetical protein
LAKQRRLAIQAFGLVLLIRRQWQGGVSRFRFLRFFFRLVVIALRFPLDIPQPIAFTLFFKAFLFGYFFGRWLSFGVWQFKLPDKV